MLFEGGGDAEGEEEGAMAVGAGDGEGWGVARRRNRRERWLVGGGGLGGVVGVAIDKGIDFALLFEGGCALIERLAIGFLCHDYSVFLLFCFFCFFCRGM